MVQEHLDHGDEMTWVVDINNIAGNGIVQGVPLVTGADLFEQFHYLLLGGHMIAQADSDLSQIPTFDGLGITEHLYFFPSDQPLEIPLSPFPQSFIIALGTVEYQLVFTWNNETELAAPPPPPPDPMPAPPPPPPPPAT